MRVNIRARLLLLIAGITIPFTLVGVIDLWQVWSIGRAQLESSMKQQVELAALAFERWVDAQREPLETIAAIASEDGAGSSLASINNFVDTRRHWLDLRIVDASGKTIRASSPTSDPPPAALTEYLASETQKSRSWTLITDRTSDELRPIVGIATPIETGGAVIARIDGGAINDLFRDIHLPAQAVIAVFDSQGQILFRKQTANTSRLTDVNSSPLFGALGNERIAVAELRSPYDEVRRVYALCRAGETDFVIAIGVPSATLYEPMQRQFTRYLLFSLLAFGVAMLAALLMQRQILWPIQRLSSAAHALGRGDFSVSAPSDAKSEVGDLGTAFNSMAQQIKEREERLTELDRLKSEFVSSVSHELRTPLTTIKTLTHVLRRVQTSDAERREYLETIEAECDRQIDLVTNLLDLSRIESGSYRIDLEPVDAAAVIVTCAIVARHAAEVRQQHIELNVPPGPIMVVANNLALQRVIRTLLENAIKYTPPLGRITVEMDLDEDDVHISVGDNGRGIDSDDLPHVFDRFYKGRPGADDPAEQTGVGLGLYVVKGLVAQINGKITVESEVGRGTRFTIQLPRMDVDEESREMIDVEAVADS